MAQRDPTADVEALRVQLAQAEDAVRARDEFLVIAAHELRSPLNALGLQLAVLERTIEQTGDARLMTQIGRARRNVDRYVRRAAVLLDVSRLAAGHLDLNVEPVSQRAILHNVTETYADEAAFRGVKIEVDAPQDHVGRWDPRMVEEIVSNLVSNALRYGAGSPVQVGASADGAGNAWFIVADRGPGVGPEQRRRIFEKFERAVPRDGDRGGFGLGLWIAAGMARAHGGAIDVRARSGGGTEFVVHLPLDPSMPATAPPPPTSWPGVQNNEEEEDS
jgi:two-component system OmpR family sensor kinase